MSKKILNASEMGKKSGELKKATLPPEYWKELGAKGNEAMKKLGPEFYKERARKIVAARMRNKKNSIDKVADLLTGKQ